MHEKEMIPKLLSITTALAVGVVALLVTVAVLIFFLSGKKVQGYAVTDTGHIIPMVSLDKPYVSDSRVTGFLDECLRRSFSHDFENLRITMAEAKKCYTPIGAEGFEAAMGPLLKDIIDKRMVLSASLEPTVITRVFTMNGVVYWESQTPLVLYRRGSRENLVPLKFRVESLVQRIPLDQDVRGIALRTINLKPI